MKRLGNTLIPAVIVILAISATVGVYAFSVWPTDKELNVNSVQVRQSKNANNNSSTNTNNTNDSGVFCTADAKICPDGSSVGRVPPSCAFAACPGANANANTNASVDTRADWKTYESSRHGYSIQYPREWSVNTFDPDAVNFVSAEPPYPYVEVDQVKLDDKISNTVDQEVSRVNITVSGVAGVKISEHMAIGGDAVNLFFTKNGNTYLVRATDTPTHQKMLDSFTFTK